MPDVGTPTIDQLHVFLAVVDAGSFSAAARKLNRRQSVVSYTIANLEDQLGGLSLFDRSARLPILTEAGRAVLSDARKLQSGVDALRAKARGLLQGLEAEVALAVDVMLPPWRLAAALAEFREAYPTVTLRLYTEALGSVARLVVDRVCAIGVSGPPVGTLDGISSRPLGAVTMVPVAAPTHPLAGHGGPIGMDGLRDHIQLVLTDRSELTRGRDFGVFSPQTWRLADLGAKHMLLLQGLGWGTMPIHQVEADLVGGRLVRLKLEHQEEVSYKLSGIVRADSPPGPAGRWLLDRLGEEDPG